MLQEFLFLGRRIFFCIKKEFLVAKKKKIKKSCSWKKELAVKKKILGIRNLFCRRCGHWFEKKSSGASEF